MVQSFGVMDDCLLTSQGSAPDRLGLPINWPAVGGVACIEQIHGFPGHRWCRWSVAWEWPPPGDCMPAGCGQRHHKPGNLWDQVVVSAAVAAVIVAAAVLLPLVHSAAHSGMASVRTYAVYIRSWWARWFGPGDLKWLCCGWMPAVQLIMALGEWWVPWQWRWKPQPLNGIRGLPQLGLH